MGVNSWKKVHYAELNVGVYIIKLDGFRHRLIVLLQSPPQVYSAPSLFGSAPFLEILAVFFIKIFPIGTCI